MRSIERRAERDRCRVAATVRLAVSRFQREKGRKAFSRRRLSVRAITLYTSGALTGRFHQAVAKVEAERRGRPSVQDLRDLHKKFQRERDGGRHMFERLSPEWQRSYAEATQKVRYKENKTIIRRIRGRRRATSFESQQVTGTCRSVEKTVSSYSAVFGTLQFSRGMEVNFC